MNVDMNRCSSTNFGQLPMTLDSNSTMLTTTGVALRAEGGPGY